ncbi:MAG: hypothetical protein SOU84_02570 [Candidatus Faecimonas sp.]|nr:hypothetical protein [Mycoplasmatota bacterium]MDY2908022.1 hypothetical protein [Candidatus Faecimonas sp.]
MKTFIRGILTTVLVFSFTLIPTIIYAEKTINNDLIGEYFKEEITSQITETMIDNLDGLSTEEYNKVKNDIENNKEINAFIEKYSNRILEDLSKEKVDDVNLEEDIKNLLHGNKELIEQAVGEKVTDEELDQALDTVFTGEDAEYSYQEIIKEVRNELPADAQAMVDGYNTLTSQQFVIVSIIISVIAIVIIALLKKPYYKWIVNVGIAGIISALFIALIGGSISLLVSVVINSINQTIKVSATPMLITAGIMLVVSIGLIVINNILDKKMEDDHVIS